MPTKSTNTELLFFAGKGGVGKTTCAAARAISEARKGRRVLVLSTDPAHSLGDALAVRLSAASKKIAVVPPGSLHAFELNAPRVFHRWLRRNRHALGQALEHGSWLDRDDINGLLDLSLPGVDELMALIEIGRIAVADRSRPAVYDRVVVDTAPTGHTLRLLGAPDAVAAVAGVLDELQQEHRLIRARFGRAGRPEAADRFIEAVARQAQEAGALLRDRRRTAFYLVTLPEELAVAETADALDALRTARIPVAELIVNRVTPPGPSCTLCDHRRAAESHALVRLRRLVGNRPVRLIASRVQEPRGTRALAAVGDELAVANRRSRVGVQRPSVSARGAKRRVNREPGPPHGKDVAPPEDITEFRDARLLLFGGKGGVGKTTCAAASAIRLAAADERIRVLLLSTDPAHSLGDVLCAAVGDVATAIPGAPPNLHGRELDAARALAARRHDLESALADVTVAVGVETGGTQHVAELLELAPPGIDELLGVVSVVESLGLDRDAPGSGSTQYDLVVCDTAPTGHALRLLEMPDVAREWLQTLLRMLLKYREVVRPGRLAQELVSLSQSVRRLQALLRDDAAARFIIVTRAADLPRLESERLFARLRKLKVNVPAFVVNAMTFDPGGCPRCTEIARRERSDIATLARAVHGRRAACAMIRTPLVAPPPRGVDRLRRWAGEWHVDSRPRPTGRRRVPALTSRTAKRARPPRDR